MKVAERTAAIAARTAEIPVKVTAKPAESHLHTLSQRQPQTYSRESPVSPVQLSLRQLRTASHESPVQPSQRQPRTMSLNERPQQLDQQQPQTASPQQQQQQQQQQQPERQGLSLVHFSAKPEPCL